jgi:hypothetical protein
MIALNKKRPMVIEPALAILMRVSKQTKPPIIIGYELSFARLTNS